MIKVSATQLRNHLFEYLDKAAAGETIVIERNQREVARLVPTRPATDWRDQMKIEPRIPGPPEELIEPVGDIWEEYV